MTRQTRALIDLAALRHNLEQARRAASGRKILAVVKADGYGHGSVRVARALADADGFAVARLDEAQVLREAGVDKRLLVLSGVGSGAEVETAAALGLDLVVHHESQAAALEAAPPGARVAIWLKVDTGMHRLGLAVEQMSSVRRRLLACRSVEPPVRLMSHLACADDRSDPFTREQVKRFNALAETAATETSLANSAGVLGWPESHGDWVRPGIMLYGISPFMGGRGVDEGLRPVMTLSSRLVAVNRVPKGEPIGYGGTWTCPEDMPVGVVAVGYGDGYPRHAPSGTPVLVNGERVSLVGRVSMDLINVDLRSQPRTKPGDLVILWGRGLPAEEVAEHAGTIAYELVCRVANRVEIVEEGGQTSGGSR